MTRRERDEDHADRSGLAGVEREAFLARLELFDANTARLYLLGAADVLDSVAGMRLRVDAVIADLVDQVEWRVPAWPEMVA